MGRTEDDSADNDEEVEGGRTTKPEVINLDVESGKPVIDGRALKVSLTKKEHVTCFASTMPPLTSSLPGQAQDMPPRCPHLSTLLHSLLADNSAGVNLDEPMRTLRTSTRNIQC